MTNLNPTSPVALEGILDLFDYLDGKVVITTTAKNLRVRGCNGTHRHIRNWSTAYGLDVWQTYELVELLKWHGGGCDCEAIFNAAHMVLGAGDAA